MGAEMQVGNVQQLHGNGADRQRHSRFPIRQKPKNHGPGLGAAEAPR
jgi:hypothetical protein